MKKPVLLLLLIVWTCPGLTEDTPLPPKISLDDATREILKDGDKRVLGASTETVDGKAVHIIKVLTPDGHIQHVKIDAETGATIGQ